MPTTSVTLGMYERNSVELEYLYQRLQLLLRKFYSAVSSFFLRTIIKLWNFRLEIKLMRFPFFSDF